MSIKKYILKVYTNWCGEDNEYSAIVDDEHLSDFEQVAQNASYNNCSDFGGFNAVLEDLFPDNDSDDGYSEEQEEEAMEVEGEYYGYNYEEYREEVHGEWDWYDLIYDCTEE